MNALLKCLLMTGVVTGLWAGCSQEGQQQTPKARIESDSRTEAASTGAEKFSQIEKATAELTSTGAGKIKGRVTFTPDSSGSVMMVRVDISGLAPGEHGLHIHSKPDCSDQASAAGGHFDPQGNKHGSPYADTHHAGDMGNVVADDNGNVQTTLKMDALAFSGPNNILNRPVIVHAGRDDLTSQPSGDAGARVACGIIRPASKQTAEQSVGQAG